MGYVEILELWHLLFKLNDESDFCGNAEISNDYEADTLQESIPRYLLLVPSMGDQILLLDRTDLHNVANVQSGHPFSLVEEAEHVAHVKEVHQLYLFLRAFFLLLLRLNVD